MKTYKKIVVAVAVISLLLVGDYIAFNLHHPILGDNDYAHLVTYHTGEQIGNTGFIFSGMEGTGGNPGGYNPSYAMFTKISDGSSLMVDINSNSTIRLGNYIYVFISTQPYNVTDISITLQEPTPNLTSSLVYHVGDAVGNTGYTFNGFYGTGAGSNQVTAIFTSNTGGQSVPYVLGSNQTLALGSFQNAPYAVMAYDLSTTTITLMQLIAIPL